MDGPEPAPQGAARRRPDRVKESVLPWAVHLSIFGKLILLFLDCDAAALLIIQTKFKVKKKKKKINHVKWLTFIYGGKLKSGRGKNEDEPLNSLHIHVLICCCFWKASIWATMATLQQALFIWKCKVNTHYYWCWCNKDGSLCYTHFCSHLIKVLVSREIKTTLLINQINKHFS